MGAGYIGAGAPENWSRNVTSDVESRNVDGVRAGLKKGNEEVNGAFKTTIKSCFSDLTSTKGKKGWSKKMRKRLKTFRKAEKKELKTLRKEINAKLKAIEKKTKKEGANSDGLDQLWADVGKLEKKWEMHVGRITGEMDDLKLQVATEEKIQTAKEGAADLLNKVNKKLKKSKLPPDQRAALETFKSRLETKNDGGFVTGLPADADGLEAKLSRSIDGHRQAGDVMGAVAVERGDLEQVYSTASALCEELNHMEGEIRKFVDIKMGKATRDLFVDVAPPEQKPASLVSTMTAYRAKRAASDSDVQRVSTLAGLRSTNAAAREQLGKTDAFASTQAQDLRELLDGYEKEMEKLQAGAKKHYAGRDADNDASIDDRIAVLEAQVREASAYISNVAAGEPPYVIGKALLEIELDRVKDEAKQFGEDLKASKKEELMVGYLQQENEWLVDNYLPQAQVGNEFENPDLGKWLNLQCCNLKDARAELDGAPKRPRLRKKESREFRMQLGRELAEYSDVGYDPAFVKKEMAKDTPALMRQWKLQR